MKNYLWNMFANIKNGQTSKKPFITQTRKKICESFLKILWKENLILGYKINYKYNKIKIFLKYTNNKPAINSLNLISKPSRRIYYSAKQISKINSSKYLIIFSTNNGLKSLLNCKKLKIGGEPFIIIN
jgi:small subunit ribosomal protein S8